MKGIGSILIALGGIGILLIALKAPYTLPIEYQQGFFMLVVSFACVAAGSIMVILMKEETIMKYAPLLIGTLIFLSLLFGFNRFDFISSISIMAVLFFISVAWSVQEQMSVKKEGKQKKLA